MTESTANLPRAVSRDEWLAARTELLAREKELVRLRDARGSYYMLDETALGRQEDREEPRGRAQAGRGAVLDFAS